MKLPCIPIGIIGFCAVPAIRTAPFFGFTPFGVYELYRAGKLFHLCKTYNLMIVHNLLVYCCCLYQAQIGFDSQLCAMRWIMFISGFILILFIIFKFCYCHDCCNKDYVN